jgi:hypothetical protein
MPGFHFHGNFQNAFSEGLAALRLCDVVDGSESAGAEKVAYMILAIAGRACYNGPERKPQRGVVRRTNPPRSRSRNG